LAWLQDASWRHASEFLDALQTSGKFVSIRAGWTAHHAAVKIITGMAGALSGGNSLATILSL
jgi:hypothetical protein